MKYFVAYDLGTGGIKSGIYGEDGISRGFRFQAYDTYFPAPGFREQRPEDWWRALAATTKDLLSDTGINPNDIVSLAVSGHSLGALPIGKDGSLLCEYVPIWNDSRASAEAKEFFNKTSEEEWYCTTGNGFPPELYSIFKILWYKKNMPEIYEQTQKFIGTKDFINYKMTGVLATDRSYASGSGLYHGTVDNAQDMIYDTYPIKHKGAMLGSSVEAINSLAAIKKVVFDDRLYTLKEVVSACKNNFESRKEMILRSHLKKAPKWGNDDAYVDSIAKDFLKFCLQEFTKYEIFGGGRLLSGIHQPHPVTTGYIIGATPDGRGAKEPISVTMTPANGTMKNGATAALKSASIFNPKLLQWNYCFMINYYSSVFDTPDGKENFKKLLTTYFDRGGMQHQPNIMDRDTLIKAQNSPENYKDLIVRLWGVSAHFVDLPKDIQNELIERLG